MERISDGGGGGVRVDSCHSHLVIIILDSQIESPKLHVRLTLQSLNLLIKVNIGAVT